MTLRSFVIFAGMLAGTLTFLSVRPAWGQAQDEIQVEKGQLLEAQAPEYGYTRMEGETPSLNILFEESFEEGLEDWSIQGEWDAGRPDTGPGRRPDGEQGSRRFAGTALSGNYANGTESRLVSPPVALPTGRESSRIVLRVWEWFEIESGHDSGVVEVSTDGGETWEALSYRSGKSGWRDHQVDLTRFGGETIQLRFRLDSDQREAFAGWYLDGLEIGVDPEGFGPEGGGPQGGVGGALGRVDLEGRQAQAEPKQQGLSAEITSLNTSEFPNLFLNVEVTEDGSPAESLSASDFEVFENGSLQTELFDVTPPEEGGNVRRADFVFLMDNSGSMADEQNAVRNNVFNFTQQLEASGIDFGLGLVRFGQSGNGGNPILEDGGSLTESASTFRDDVWSRNVASGRFEPGWDALHEAATKVNFRPGAARVVILITDESVTGQGNRGTYSKSEARQAMNGNDVTAYSLICTETSSNCPSLLNPETAIQDYGDLAESTGGRFFEITEPFDQILNDIGQETADSYVVRYQTENDQLDGTERDVRVEVTDGGETASDEESYFAGGRPRITRSEETRRVTEEDTSLTEGTQQQIQVEVTDQSAPSVQEVTLYYKPTSESSYQSIKLPQTPLPNIRQGTIPGSAVQEPGVDYYITATDGQSSVSKPSTTPQRDPYQIAVLPNRSPEIVHNPIGEVPPNQAVEVEAEVTDNTNQVDEVQLFYRRVGELVYQEEAMTSGSGSSYTAEIPASFATEEGREQEIEYYISATDDVGVSSRRGSEDQPLTVNVVQGVAAPPSAATEAATEIEGGKAQLNGEVNPNGVETTVEFEYYPSGQPGNAQVVEADESPLSGSGTQTVSAVVEGLNSGTEYTFFVRATSSQGTGEGGEETFTTGETALTELQLGPLTLTADQIQETSTSGVFEATGNVTLNETLRFDGTVTANTKNAKIKGNGGIDVIPGPVDEIYNGSYELNVAQQALEASGLAGTGFTVAGLDVQIDRIEILGGQTTGLLKKQGPGVQIEGQVVFPELLSNEEAQINTIQVTDGGVDVAGKVSVGEVPIKPVGAELETFVFEFDTVSDPSRFSGEADLAVPLFAIGASVTILGGDLQMIGMDVEPPKPVPIGNTGMGLARVGGSVDELATDDPLIISAEVDIQPSVGAVSTSVVKFEQVMLTYDFGGSFSAGGKVSVFEQEMAGAGVEVSGGENAAKLSFYGELMLEVPKAKQPVLDAELTSSIFRDPPLTPLSITGASNGKLVIPEFEAGFPFDKIQTLAGLPYTVAETNNNLESEPLEGTGEFRGDTEIKLGKCSGFGSSVTCLNIGMAYGIRYDNGDVSASFARNFDNLNLKLFPKSALKLNKSAQQENRFEGKSLIIGSGRTNPLLKSQNDTLRQSFTLNQETSALVLRVEGESAPPQYTVSAPDGRTISPETIGSSSKAVYGEMDSQNKTFYVIKNPMSGEWTVNLPDDGTEYALDVIGSNPAPALDLDSPEQAGSSVDLAWTVDDPEEEASVDLYYDTDLQDRDGVLIAEDLSEDRTTFTWNPEDVPTGTYYVYAVADDGQNAPVVDYATEPLQLVATGAPSAPNGVSLTPEDTALVASWNGVDEADRYTVYYSQGQDPTFESPSVGTRGPEVNLTRLTPGRTYHAAVTAVDTSENGGRSQLSPVETVTYESQTLNNAPLITTTDPASVAREGETYQQQIEAEDTDGDALTYELARGPEGMNISSGGALSWSPVPGSPTVKVRVRDGQGAADSLSWQLRSFDRLEATASLEFNRSTYTGENPRGQLILSDPELNELGVVDSQRVRIESEAQPQGRELLLQETGANTGRFRSSFGLGNAREETVLNVNRADTLTVSYEDTYPDTTITAEASYFEVEPPRQPPQIAGFPSDAGPVTTFPTLAWSGLDGVGQYQVQVATDSSFQNIAAEQTVSDSSLALSGLEKGTTYFWRVRGRTVVAGPWSAASSFETRPAELQASARRTFGDASGPRDYRLVALPGAVDEDLGAAVPGEAGLEWQAWWDTGASADFLEKYDGSGTFRFQSGRGFWLARTDSWQIDRSVPSVDLRNDKTIALDLHDGWNIISNPFGQDVSWTAVETANADAEGDELQTLWSFQEGTFRQAESMASAREGVAYYFLNDRGLDELLLPYPETNGGKATGEPSNAPEEATLAVTAQQDSLSSAVQLRLVDGATGERGERQSVPAPPAQFSSLSLRIDGGAERPARRRYLATAQRQTENQGQAVPLRLIASGEGAVSLRVNGLDATQSRRAVLLHPAQGQSFDLREGEDPQISLSQDTTRLRLALGDKAYVQKQKEQVRPDETTLTAYPNPVRQEATLAYTLPEAQEVRLVAYDVLGRKVTTLAEGRRQAGRHQASFEAAGLSSGIYLVRLKAGSRTITQKVTVAR
jgi:VWFA-related protein